MKKRRSIKRALTLSTLSICLCTSMLVGTTYAWFTDTASTAVNSINSGTLDVELEMWNGEKWVDATAQTLYFRKSAEAPSGEAILWEPGCTYELPRLRIRNNGDLALKYKFQITGIIGDAKLNEVIDWNFTLTDGAIAQSDQDQFNNFSLDEARSLLPGDHEELFIYGHMQENAGNEYKNLYIRGISICVYATQDTVESDSYGDQYDKEADFVHTVSDQEELLAAIAKGGTIRLTDDILLDSPILIRSGRNIILDMNGKTITLVDGADESCDPLIDLRSGSSLTIDGDGAFDLGANPGFSFIAPRGDLTINSGKFTIDTDLSSYGSFFLGINGGTGKLIINGGYFDGGYYVPGKCFDNCRTLLNGSWGQYIRVYGGTFVGQNPAWGDEGMAFLCPYCSHTPGAGYCQALFLEGQSREDTTLPDGYTITEGLTTDGRPTFTVNYTP